MENNVRASNYRQQNPITTVKKVQPQAQQDFKPKAGDLVNGKPNI